MKLTTLFETHDPEIFAYEQKRFKHMQISVGEYLGKTMWAYMNDSFEDQREHLSPTTTLETYINTYESHWRELLDQDLSEIVDIAEKTTKELARANDVRINIDFQ